MNDEQKPAHIPRAGNWGDLREALANALFLAYMRQVIETVPPTRRTPYLVIEPGSIIIAKN